jgi:glutaminyl-peptide cyclotransferase
MIKHKILGIITLLFSVTNCNVDKKNLFSIDSSQFKSMYHREDSIFLSVKNEKNETIDSVVYFNNDLKIGSVKENAKFNFSLNNQKLGYQNIKAVVYYSGENIETTTRVEVVSSIEPQLLSYKIINTYPHDIKAYTQGLEFYRDTLYEGTGNGAGNGTGKRGISSLRKTNYKTGKVFKTVELAEQYFGEGITVLNNKVYQLTYQNNEGYVYNADTFKKEKTLKYYKNMEGWGLTNNGTHLFMTDSSEKIHIIDPETFKNIDYINVYTNGTKIPSVNELEWIDGKIYGNIYGRDAIAVIDPKSGSVEAVINLGDLKKKVTQHPDLDVLNGIAYNPKTKTIFVTGKNWDKMFEIIISK